MPDLPGTVHHRVRPGYKVRQITERKSSGTGLLLKIVSSPISGKGSLLQNKLQNGLDRKSTRLNSSHSQQSRMPSSA